MRWALAVFAFGLGLGSCTNARSYAQAICALVDVSGTYADQKAEVVNILKRGVLPKMMPGDSLLVIRIDDQSYRKSNLEANVTFDVRPSQANAQKLAVATQLDRLAQKNLRAAHTDIRGAMMLGAEYLKETGAASRVMLVFSDLEEDLPKGVTRKLSKDEFADLRVVAMNVKRLKGDSANPSTYRQRLSTWEKTVKESGAKDWRVVLDTDKLLDYLEQTR